MAKKHSDKISIRPDHSLKALEKLRAHLQNADFSDVLNDFTTSAFSKFDKILYEARDSCCPLKRSKVKVKNFNPWFTKAFLISSRCKDRLHRRARVRDSVVAWNKFKTYKKVFDRLCRAAKLL